MAEWLFEEGIGENRAILVEGNQIVEAAIELPGALRAGGVVEARLKRVTVPGRRAIAEAKGEEIQIEPPPVGVGEGALFRAEIMREALPEPGRPKPARSRPTDAPVRAGPALSERIGKCARHDARGSDRFEQAGWSELLDEATRGEIAFEGGALRLSLTPAMTLFDVDGTLRPEALAIAGAAAAARAIRRLGICGSMGIDLPTLPGRDARRRAAEALDALLPPPFERTQVNGFGFLQVVRRRERPSLPEILAADPIGAAARALLRRAERAAGGGALTLQAAPAVIARIEQEPGWTEELARRAGARVRLQADPGLSISAGHVQRATN